MPSSYPQTRNTVAVHMEIARSPEPTGALVNCFGVSAETIRKWRKRGPYACQDHSSRPPSCRKKPPRKSVTLAFCSMS